MKSRLENNFFLALIGIGVLILLVSCFGSYHYALNDDILIKDILSGSYTGTPDGHCIQMLYPIGVLVALLYRIARGVPWFGLLLIVAQYGACYLILERSMSMVAGIRKKLLVLTTECLVFFVFFSYWMLNLQYSMTCAFLVAAAILLFVTAKGRKDELLAILLLVLAFCIRTEMLLLLSPFVAFVGFSYWRNQDKKNGRCFFDRDNLIHYGSFLGVVAVCFLLVLGIDHLAYAGREWSEFRNLFDARTKVYDFYGIPDYEGNEAIYAELGLGEEGYRLLDNYNYFFSPQVDAGLFEKLVDYSKENLKVGYFKVPIRQGIWDYRYWHAGKSDRLILLVLAAFYVATALLGLIQKNWSLILELPMLFVVRSILWLYLILRGRYPERIVFGLMLVELSCLCYLLLRELAGCHIGETILVVICVVALIGLRPQLASLQEDKALRSSVNREWQDLQTYVSEHPENYYLLDIYSTVRYSETVWHADNTLKNYDYAGGWACKSPLQTDKLSKWKLTGELEKLAQAEELRFISYTARDVEWMEDWFYTQNVPIALEETDSFGQDNGDLFRVYRLQRME